ncbi:hypothetical protein J5N97_009370 [Dioscorea zingiberensis]|uniref:Uncharacterized protein n=1 Tax=Dioscorea zingiberensis TaxID=325984 RepID=A0A9D5CZB4_9LILI|nr:hypothetical protein J5N97_009370 [Dioscorea zingiberensis]
MVLYMPCSHVPETIALPRGVLFLAHNGKVAWDVKWRPKTSSKPEDKQLIGYLAVLLGNSSLEVWEVPQPSLIKCGDRQCIPLTVEWSRSSSCDLILAGCHDGTINICLVAMWKFSTHRPSQDAKPLLCFTADTGPIRALAWTPEEKFSVARHPTIMSSRFVSRQGWPEPSPENFSDPESLNLVVTSGQEGLKFWDLRDPHRPLWELCPVQRSILSLDWGKDPRSQGHWMGTYEGWPYPYKTEWQLSGKSTESRHPLAGGVAHPAGWREPIPPDRWRALKPPPHHQLHPAPIVSRISRTPSGSYCSESKLSVANVLVVLSFQTFIG